MSQQAKLKPMSDVAFRMMRYTMSLMDMFSREAPRRRLTDAPLKHGMKVVDYGCGPGRYTLPIAEAVGPQGRVYAVDIQPLAIETVRRKAADRGLANVETVLVDSYDTGLPGASVDMVLLVDVIHGVDDRDALLREIYRVLKPGGFLFMDSGHASVSEVRKQVDDTGLFETVKFDGRNMLMTARKT